ncbi:hypothetical protein BH23ACT12_BH23ACT12_19950 [soil metagenome]
MKGRPVRGGYRRKGWAAVLLLMTLAGCSAGDGPEAEDDPDRPIATAAVVEPGICGSTVVLSDEAADTGTPLTEDQMLARVTADATGKPEGFTTQTVVADEGLGSFKLSAPQGYSPFWRAGTSPDILLELAEPLDPEWAGFWEQRMRSGDTNTRAIMVDGTREDAVAAVHVTLTQAYPQTGSALADRFAQDYSEGGGTIGERCGVRANGDDGAFVEHTVPGEFLDSNVDRVQLQFLIPDPPNDLLWGVTCDVPRPLAGEVKKTCREIASTFRPLPAVTG